MKAPVLHGLFSAKGCWSPGGLPAMCSCERGGHSDFLQKTSIEANNHLPTLEVGKF